MRYQFDKFRTLIRQVRGGDFDGVAIELFRYQAAQNPLYRDYVRLLGTDPQSVRRLTDIPFLPVPFFRSHRILTGDVPVQARFKSSGTTGQQTSAHLVADLPLYEQTLLDGFRKFYGAPEQYVFLALLPSYLERSGSSLVHMASLLIGRGRPGSGFFLHDFDELRSRLEAALAAGERIVLLGVTFALIDFAEAHPLPLGDTIVMETGGMKGRKKEWTRAEVHDYLCRRWSLPGIHSEYGMTELLSQAYALSGGQFRCADTMRVLARDVTDPLSCAETGTGALNIVDLANVHSCCFLATEDIGTVRPDGFEVNGRMDYSALRGCSLLTA